VRGAAGGGGGAAELGRAGGEGLQVGSTCEPGAKRGRRQRGWKRFPVRKAATG
jgi:hypothetical protein